MIGKAGGEHRTTATIYDVAKLADVAPSTVSRAFSRPGRLNGATETRILEVAAGLGYQPNRSARGLSTGRTNNLGMLAPNVANPFFAEFLRGFQHVAARRGYDVIFIDTDEDAHHERSGIRALSSQTDALVLCAPRSHDDELLELIDPERTVVVNHELAGVPCVVIDSRQALAELFDALERCHHQRIVYARGPVSAVSDRIRRRIIRGICRTRGVDLHVTAPAPDGPELAIAAVDLALETGATAVVAHSDVAAMWVLHECHERGIAVPEGLSVVGHDRIAFGAMMTPALTTIDVHIAEVAAATAERLVALVEGQPLGLREGMTRIKADFTLRRSLAPPQARSAADASR